MLKDKTIGFIGGGNMAEALIRGLLAGGVPTADILVAEPVAERRASLADRYGIAVTEDNRSVAAASEVIILAVKPQTAPAVLAEIGAAVTPEKLLVSIMAGIRTDAIEAACPAGARLVRVMPNTPALVLEAASAIAPGACAT
ncbi:MAG: NAD(P)-binding domain-containing protein, partial [Geobacteraceae bacterium]|nr:NAD(P)-binding domain-containing protein [Geobacteraceae bacterium]